MSQLAGGITLAKSPRSTQDLALPVALAETQAEAPEEPGIVHIKEIPNLVSLFSDGGWW